MSNIQECLMLARRNLGKGDMDSSARFCLSEALKAYDERNDWESCRMWCLKSLSYSVGIFHSDYKRAI